MTSAGLKKRVAYYFDDDVGAFAYTLQHPMKPHRIKMAHNLVMNYDLDQHMEILRPQRATPQSMTAFHTDEFIDFLVNVTPETVEQLTGNGQRFLIGEDCPAFEGVFDFCSISAGGSMSGARRLNSGDADIAVNWAGGLHHAKKREASGFCYVNDIVLAILELLRYHARVLYIDIDIHHGDGVEEAFYSTDRVMSCSFHKFGDYFPGTGDIGDTGVGKGKGYAVNVPLRDGIDDETYASVFKPVIQRIMDWYRPGAVILQCGADSLAEDKLGCFNLSMQGHSDCVRFVKSFDVPLMILGGGGYTIRNVARTWAYETGIACGQELDVLLPFNEYIEHYGPEFKLDVPRNNMANANSKEYLNYVRQSVIEGLKDLPFAPSVGTQQVPRDARDEIYEDDAEADTRITQRQRDAHISRYGDVLSDSDDDMDIDGGLSSAYRRRGASVLPAASATADDTVTRGSRRRQRRKHFDEEQFGAAEYDPSGIAANAVAAAVNGTALNIRYPAPQLNGDDIQTRPKRNFFRPSAAAQAVLPTTAVVPTAAAAPDRFLIRHTEPRGDVAIGRGLGTGAAVEEPPPLSARGGMLW